MSHSWSQIHCTANLFVHWHKRPTHRGCEQVCCKTETVLKICAKGAWQLWNMLQLLCKQEMTNYLFIPLRLKKATSAEIHCRHLDTCPALKNKNKQNTPKQTNKKKPNKKPCQSSCPHLYLLISKQSKLHLKEVWKPLCSEVLINHC